ncbi:hypothetical protein GIB67_012915 [Kingdonia uniflora]|uniref:Uncharacterized protein n=1 Tax=Kingdonia uniflora TaxID=39325 RepID=A0A7J7NGL4_9MAGN|nr:hypothetical protein GIB67_012915 [Kingdonia uniflora]
MLKSVATSGTTGSGESVKEKRRMVESSEKSGEKVAEERPVVLDDLKEVEERARLAAFHREEDTSKMPKKKDLRMMSMVTNFIFPPPPSLFITTMSVISFVSLANTALSEIRGKHLQYSKFWNTNTSQKVKLTSRTGMLVLYTPAFLAGAVSLYLIADDGLRVLLVTAALTIHFLKRVLEAWLSDLDCDYSSTIELPMSKYVLLY